MRTNRLLQVIKWIVLGGYLFALLAPLLVTSE
jgi:hypothetical protein